MVTERERIICITCPKGCTLEVDREGNTVVNVIGGCKRGQEYARQELLDPRRKVATTVRISGAIHPLLPVYTSAAFPKPKIPELLALLRQINVSAPVQTNQVIFEDALGTGINILASRDMQEVRPSSPAGGNPPDSSIQEG
jgi:CxxC motif-containing protein